jgi:hypothetical protein
LDTQSVSISEQDLLLRGLLSHAWAWKGLFLSVHSCVIKHQ